MTRNYNTQWLRYRIGAYFRNAKSLLVAKPGCRIHDGALIITAFRTRFAPSPTGYLHFGHAASALHVWHAAERAGGEVLLRIEDIDTTRCRPKYTEAIYEDLRWLGLSWPEPVRVQSEHFDEYELVVADLANRGLAYRCFRTRAEMDSQDKPFVGGPISAAEEQARLAAGEAFAWRLSLKAAKEVLGPEWNELAYTERTEAGLVTHRAAPETHGDIVIARKDSPSAYHLAATHDDALQGMTDIVRGEDLIDAPHIQTLLQVLMGWPQPIYHHHGLIMGEDGKKLSKSAKSLSLAALRADGITAQQIRTQLGFY